MGGPCFGTQLDIDLGGAVFLAVDDVGVEGSGDISSSDKWTVFKSTKTYTPFKFLHPSSSPTPPHTNATTKTC